MSRHWSSPGTAIRWTWASKRPGQMYLPCRSMVVAFVGFGICEESVW